MISLILVNWTVIKIRIRYLRIHFTISYFLSDVSDTLKTYQILAAYGLVQTHFLSLGLHWDGAKRRTAERLWSVRIYGRTHPPSERTRCSKDKTYHGSKRGGGKTCRKKIAKGEKRVIHTCVTHVVKRKFINPHKHTFTEYLISHSNLIRSNRFIKNMIATNVNLEHEHVHVLRFNVKHNCYGVTWSTEWYSHVFIPRHYTAYKYNCNRIINVLAFFT